MTLYIRMALYFLFGNLSGSAGFNFDSYSGHVTISVDDLAAAIAGIIGFVGTFLVSRLAKKRGGKT